MYSYAQEKIMDMNIEGYNYIMNNLSFPENWDELISDNTYLEFFFTHA
jgi:hypothetical protein